jgi:phosphate transport system substrate-binding protein
VEEIKNLKEKKEMSRKLVVLFGLLMTASMLLAACGGVTTPAAPVVEEPTAEVPVATEALAAPVEEIALYAGYDLADLSGTINTAGSSTVYPLAEAVAQNFYDDGFGGEVAIASIGSGAGFERFCTAGETDIANASRRIKDSEVEACAAIGRTPIEFRVGTDAIAVVVSSENDFVTDVTLEELGLIFTTAVNWSDVRPEWPNEPILRFTPGTDSGTFDYFVEEVVTKPQELEVDAAEALVLNANNLQLSEDDNVLVAGVEGSPYAVGYFGFAYYVNEADNLHAISINGVMPDAQTAEDGSYKLARPLFVYSDASIIQSRPEVAAFLDYFITNVNGVITEVGYFPASEEALTASHQALLDVLP